MAKTFLIDVARCNGCHNCQIACKDEHCGHVWLPYAQAQPEIGQFWMKVNEKERGQVPVVRVSYTPTICAHCADAPCAKACPSGAFQRRDDGLLLIDPETCTGCGSCVQACPVGAVYFNDELGIAQKCTGCAHLLDDGWTVPRCVDSCATGALQFGDEAELDLEGAAPLPGLEGAGARAYYRNLPKRFAAGCVYDADANDVIIGATVELLDAAGAVVAQMETDEFGDWEFDQIEPGAYTVVVRAEGYPEARVAADVTEKDLFTGDLGVRKA